LHWHERVGAYTVKQQPFEAMELRKIPLVKKASFYQGDLHLPSSEHLGAIEAFPGQK